MSKEKLVSVNPTKIEALHKEWSYEFENWTRQHEGFFPIELVESKDTSEPYEMHRAHIFKNLNQSYALVTESGCSCYSSSDARIEFFKSKREAKKSFDDWFK